jgi:hypothetical protein
MINRSQTRKLVPNANALLTQKVLNWQDWMVTDRRVTKVFMSSHRTIIVSGLSGTYAVYYYLQNARLVSDYQIVWVVCLTFAWIRNAVIVVQMNINTRVSIVFECLPFAEL